MSDIGSTKSDKIRNSTSDLNCSKCERGFKSKDVFTKHLECLKPPGGYRCENCNERFCMRSKLEEHIRSEHQFQEVFCCEICEESFHNFELLKRHMQAHEVQSSTITEAKICESCGKEFRTKRALTDHRQSKCGTAKLHKCDECGRTYMNKSILAVHKLQHNGSKSYCCSYCGIQFLSYGQLKVHEPKHTKERPFKCDICGKAFPYRESLVTHSSIHTGIKPYVCENCQGTFSCIGNLQKHRKSRPSSCGLPQFCTTFKRTAPRVKTKTYIKKPKPKTISTKVIEDDVDNNRMEQEDVETSIEFLNENSNGSNISIELLLSSDELETIDKTADLLDNGCFNSASNVHKYKIEIMDTQGDSIEFNIKPVEADKSCNQENSDENEEEEILTTLIYEDPVPSDADGNFEFKTQESAKDLKTEDDDDQPVFLETDELYECQLCLLVFSSAKYLSDHLVSEHDHSSDEHCSKVLNFQVLFEKHLKSRDKELKNPIPQDQTADEIAIKAEEQSNCGKSSKFECDFCGRFYHSLGSLKTHQTIHTHELPFLCSICGKGFRTKGQSSIHMRRHTGEKPFQCHICPKTFSHRQSLLTHVTVHTNEKPYLCQCGQRFSCIQNLISHRNTFSGTCGTQPLDTKPTIQLGVVKGQVYIGEKIK